ncbi:hypothetical protein [Cellulomonas fimi]|uniref:hypothetical protein n=1 Tax=Cellulomonas fimi TaxID=1708 RepID=UPI002359C8A2|nr:hypothetical protein [Cellulomonas fimi]
MVRTIGKVDGEVLVGYERLAGANAELLQKPMVPNGEPLNTSSSSFEFTEAFLPAPEREILIGHGNEYELGEYDENFLMIAFRKRMTKGLRYQFLLYACRVAAGPDPLHALGGRLFSRLRALGYTVEGLAPTTLAYVVSEHDHYTGSPYNPAATNSVKGAAVASYRAALMETVSELIEVLQNPDLPAPDAPSPVRLIRGRTGHFVEANPNPDAPAPLAPHGTAIPLDQAASADFETLRTSNVKVKVLTKANKDQYRNYSRNVANLILTLEAFRATFTASSIEAVLTKLKVIMGLKTFNELVLQRGGLSYDELTLVLDSRYRRKLLDPATAQAAAPGAKGSAKLPQPGDPNWATI